MTHEHDNDAPIRIPIVEERLHVDKQVTESGRVVVTSTVVSEDLVVRDTLASTAVRIERVPVDRFIDDVPSMRTESDRTIVPVFEEVLVKRIRLIEEVHFVTETRSETVEQAVPLRRMQVSVERHGPADAATGNTASPGEHIL